MTESTVAIIGAGPAGMSAAIQLTRMGHSLILFEKTVIGGLLKNARQVDNYLGLREQSGRSLIEKFKDHLEYYQVPLIREKVSQVEYSSDHNIFTISTPTQSFNSKYLIIASGTRPKQHPIEELVPKKLSGIVHHEVYPLMQLENEKVAIMGGGDAAFDYALNLYEKSNEVTLIHRSEKFSCLTELKNQVLTTPQINVLSNHTLLEVQVDGDELPPKATLLLKNNDIETKISGINYLIIAIGRSPELNFLSTNLKEQLDDLKKKGILYLAGDVNGSKFRQTAIACGEGIRSAMEIDRRENENT